MKIYQFEVTKKDNTVELIDIAGETLEHAEYLLEQRGILHANEWAKYELNDVMSIPVPTKRSSS